MDTAWPKNRKSTMGMSFVRKLARCSADVVGHPLSKGIAAIFFGVLTFQLLPQRQGQSQSVGQILQDAWHPISNSLPSFLGFWSVNTPSGVFDPNFPTGEEISREAATLLPMINKLREQTFFRIFKVDLSKECPFWARNDLCSSGAGSCSVCECTDDQIPLPWKAKPIEHFVDRKFYDEEEFTPWIDDHSNSLGTAQDAFLEAVDGTDFGGVSTYVDLTLNPPGFTSYRGRNIWGLIYKENCLREEETELQSLNHQECEEENFFERMISGLQTAIMVLAAEYNEVLKTRLPLPLTAPNKHKIPGSGLPGRHRYDLDLFRRRVASNRTWVENLYMDFSLLLRTLAKVQRVVEACPCYTGTPLEDNETRNQLQALLEKISTLPSAAPERLQQPLFSRKQDLAIRQFTNISRIFDCVECEKCRLHGKVKLAALQVALKAAGDPVRALERNEITALVNAIHYFADAVIITHKMDRRVKLLRCGVVTALAILCGLFLRLRKFSAVRSRVDDAPEIAMPEAPEPRVQPRRRRQSPGGT